MHLIPRLLNALLAASGSRGAAEPEWEALKLVQYLLPLKVEEFPVDGTER